MEKRIKAVLTFIKDSCKVKHVLNFYAPSPLNFTAAQGVGAPTLPMSQRRML